MYRGDRSAYAFAMEHRKMTHQHLALAEDHVALGADHIARQKEIVTEMERDGHEDAAATARELLATFETPQRSHVEERNRLRAELAACK